MVSLHTLRSYMFLHLSIIKISVPNYGMYVPKYGMCVPKYGMYIPKYGTEILPNQKCGK